MAKRLYRTVSTYVDNPYEVIPGTEDQEAMIESRFGQILFRFPLMHIGRECDAEGYVIRDGNGDCQLVLSDISDWFIADPESLQAKIDQYRKVLDLSEQALLMVKKDE